jgi:hypothetical protein
MFLYFINQFYAIPTEGYSSLASPTWLPFDAESKLPVHEILKFLWIFLRIAYTKLRNR